MAAMVPFAGWSATGVKFARKSVTGASGRKITLGYVMDTAGKIDFGNSGQLRTVIKPLASEQAHHLIPWASRQHEVVQAAARSTSANAFHMNEALNGLAVSTARHNGSHAAYNDLVEFRLEQIRNKIKDGNGNIDPDVALQEIIGLINKIKTAINSTNAPINQVTF
ncbi:MAG: AHH domain-containing protein [Saprospirales bacterium]|nr:AHH domain-containing protein [Saprospirales bacterium]